MRTAYFENVLRMQDDRATQQKGGHMAAKQTYSIRLDADQLLQLDARAESMDLPVGCLIRLAIDAYLKQQEEKDYLSEVEKRIAVTIDRLARQVAKDRAEQQMVVGMLDYLREWLAFTLPTPADKNQANDLMRERDKVFGRKDASGTPVSGMRHWIVVSQGWQKRALLVLQQFEGFAKVRSNFSRCWRTARIARC